MKPTKEMIKAGEDVLRNQSKRDFTPSIELSNEVLTAALALLPSDPTADEDAIDALRLEAFKSNDPVDRQAYFDATSKWFQDRHFRRLATQTDIASTPKAVATWEKFENGNNYLKTHDKELFANSNEIDLYTSPPPPHPNLDREGLLEEARRTLDKPFCVLFLDGRNEHGSHVLPSYPRAFEPVDDDIDDQAEEILAEADRLGFVIGEHVWAEFVDVSAQIGDEGRIELSGYWEFKGINVEMSRVINASLLSKLEGSSHGKA